jgi:hypothetical protein
MESVYRQLLDIKDIDPLDDKVISAFRSIKGLFQKD